MSQAKPKRAARHPDAGRLFALGAVSLGVLLVVISAYAASALRAEWFWPLAAQDAARERQAHFDKLYAAYVIENARRGRAGTPALVEEPEALRRARARLEEAKRPLRIAQQRPGQIADVLRAGGAALCVAGALVGLLSRRPNPSASDGAAAQ